MPDVDNRGPSGSDRDSDALRIASESTRLAEAALALLGCETEQDVYELIGDFTARVVPDSIVVVNEATPSADALTTRAIRGLDDSLLARAAGIFGFTMVGSCWEMLPEYRHEVLSGELERLSGGLVGLLAREVPRPIAEASAKIIGGYDVYTVGIADGQHALGSVRILTRTPEDRIPAHIIESFSRHCFSALNGIIKARELAEEAERNRLVLHHMSESLALHEIILDCDGVPCDYRFLDVNPMFEATTGLKAENIIGRTVREVLPGVEPVWIERYGAVATTGIPARFEEYSSQIGKHLAISAYSPQPGQVVSVGLDVTERVREEEALRVSEERFAALFEQAPLGYQSLDENGCFIEVNPAWLDALGYERSEVIGAWFGDFLAPQYTEAFRERFPLFKRRGRIHSEFEMVRKDGTHCFMGFDGRIAREADGSFRQTHCILTDITERRRAEETLRKSERDLLEAQRIAHVGSWTFDPATRDIAWSTEMFHIWGLDPTKGAPPLEDHPKLIHPDDHERLALFSEAMLDGTPHKTELRIVRADGTERTVIASCEAERDSTGLVVGIRGTCQDITQRKETEDAILRLNEELDQRVQERTAELVAANMELAEATRVKSDFLAAMSHELRTPLNSIIGFSDLLLGGMVGELEPEQHKQIGMINASGKHLLSLVDDILDLSKIEAGQTNAVFEPIDVEPLAHRLVEMVRPLAHDKGLELLLECDAAVGVLVSDPRFVSQILTNLLGNAVKFTDVGSVSLCVSAREDEVLFEVSDTGRGILPEDLPHVMERFYQAKATVGAKNQGTGLGLTISLSLAEMIGGAIDVASEYGSGSTFTLRVPREPKNGLV
ncbi:MAG: PAS domain-containing sensor histidine kinase [Actinobacteria bacterium]|nr:MAG: PAS domain-containing sensor histidine kinase [Actinomycetota bacterium]